MVRLEYYRENGNGGLYTFCEMSVAEKIYRQWRDADGCGILETTGVDDEGRNEMMCINCNQVVGVGILEEEPKGKTVT